MALPAKPATGAAPTRRRHHWAIFVLLSSALGLLACMWLFGPLTTSKPGRAYNESVPPARFSSIPSPDASPLAETDVLLTADAPLKPGRNAVWCASFLAGWQEIRRTCGGDLQLEGAETLCATLNAQPDIASTLPPEGSFATSGIYSPQWAQHVRDEVARKVTRSALPDFPGATPGQPISYSCLYSRLAFPKPYFDWTNGMDFRGTQVHAFGIEEEHEYAYDELRRQIEVLYVPQGFHEDPEEFAIDLDRDSSPNQLILAKLAPGASLDDTWKSLADKMSRFSKEADGYYKRFGVRDVVGVPEMNFDLWHEFPELSGRKQLSPGPGTGLPRQFLQNIRFRLDRSGAELWSQTPAPCAPIPAIYTLHGPFLLAMKRRNAAQPYLMLWIETPELLRKR